MLYNKDKEYTLKYIDINGQQQELKYTPEKDMSVPEIITMLQNKDKNFYKLLKEVNNKKEEDKMLKESYEPLDDDIQMEIYEMIVGGYYTNQTQEENIENTIMEIEEEYPELKDKMEDVRFYVEQKVPEVYEEKDEEDLEESKQVKTESIEFNASTFDELEEEVTEMYENDKIDDDMYETILDLIDVERSNTEEYINNRRKVTNTDYKDEIGIEEDNVEALKKAIKEKLPELTTESKLVEDEEDNDIEDIETKETVEPEDTTELQQEMEEVVTELDNVTEEETLGLEVTVGTIDVLIKDEEAAIDGYNSFLNQIKDTIPETVYNTIEKQLKEVIQDEEDHINILNTIKENLNTTEAPIEENKETVLTENVTVEDIFKELDIDIDSPAAEYEWDTVQEYLNSNPDITLEQAVKDIEEYFETGLL